MRRPPPAPAKGTRHPGAGRVKGTPNRVSVEARVLVGELVNDPGYQARLRRDFTLRKLHPTIEGMVWAYHAGRPRQDITIDASVNVTAKYSEERRALLALDLPALAQLAAESQRLVDAALALTKAGATPQDIDIPAEVSSGPEVSAETLGNMVGSDNNGYVATAEPVTAGENSPTTEGE